MIADRIPARLLCAVLGLLPIVPPEHVHEARENGHVHLVVHRHLQPHGLLHRHDESAPSTIDDDDDPILTLTAVYTVPACAFVATPPLVRLSAFLAPVPVPTFQRQLDDVEQLIHGPPRAPTPLRGPPFAPSS